MGKIKNKLTAKVLLGGATAMTLAMSVGVAHAAPTSFSWNPTGASTPLNGGAIIDATNYNVADFASVSINSGTGAFTEVGALKIIDFLNSGSTVISTGLGTTYSLFLRFNGTGVQSAVPTVTGTASSGVFNSLNYQLVGSTSGSPPLSFAVSNGAVAVNDPGTEVVLGYGDLVPGTGFVTLTKTANGFSPTANVNLNFNQCTASGQGGVCTANQSSFFLAPTSGLNLQVGNFSASDVATTLVTGATTFVNLNGGGGNLTFSTAARVPEPATLAMFGVGLLALTGLARRRSQS